MRLVLALVAAALFFVASNRACAQDAQVDAPPPVEAPPPVAPPTDAELAEARHSFQVASDAFEGGDYETAVSEFRAAYELTRATDLLFNIYLAEERAGRLDEAEAALTQYLAAGTIEAEQRRLLDRRLERLRARIASREPVALEEEEPEVLLASPIAPPEPEPIVDTSAPMAAIVTLALAGAFAVSFGVFVALSEVEDQRLAGVCGRDAGGWCTASDVSALQVYDVIADVSWIGAAVLAVTGTVLMFALPWETHERPRAAALPWVSPTGAGLVWRQTL